MSAADYEITKFEIRVLLRHYWKKGLTTRGAAEAICEVEGAGTVGKSTAIDWFKRFSKGDFDLNDKPRSGRPSKLNDGDLQAALDAEPSSSTRDLAAELGVGKSAIHRHLQQMDFVHKKPRPRPA